MYFEIGRARLRVDRRFCESLRKGILRWISKHVGSHCHKSHLPVSLFGYFYKRVYLPTAYVPTLHSLARALPLFIFFSPPRTYIIEGTVNTVNHVQTRETHCGLNGGSLDRRKGKRRPARSLRKKAQESNGRRRTAITRERKSTVGKHNANSNETNLTTHPRAKGATLYSPGSIIVLSRYRGFETRRLTTKFCPPFRTSRCERTRFRLIEGNAARDAPRSREKGQ